MLAAARCLTLQDGWMPGVWLGGAAVLDNDEPSQYCQTVRPARVQGPVGPS
jgi:hypothetical protein